MLMPEWQDWSELSEDDKKRRLFFRQKELLNTFLAHHTITQAQYDKSLGDLIIKMGMEKYESERSK